MRRAIQALPAGGSFWIPSCPRPWVPPLQAVQAVQRVAAAGADSRCPPLPWVLWLGGGSPSPGRWQTQHQREVAERGEAVWGATGWGAAGRRGGDPPSANSFPLQPLPPRCSRCSGQTSRYEDILKVNGRPSLGRQHMVRQD